MGIRFAFLIFGTLLFQAHSGEWLRQESSFRYSLQEHSRWWGCSSAERQIYDYLEFMGAKDIDLYCSDTRGYPRVSVNVRYSVPSTDASEGSADNCQPHWVYFHYSRNRYCNFFLELNRVFSDKFSTRGTHLRAFCQGEQGNFIFEGERLSCE